MEPEKTDDASVVVSHEVTHVNFCADCRHAGYRTGFDRSCLRVSLTNNEGFPTYTYPTCANERAPGGKCSNGQFFSPRTVQPPTKLYELPPLPPITLSKPPRRPPLKYEYEQDPFWSRNERERRQQDPYEITLTEKSVMVTTACLVCLLVYLAVTRWSG